MANVFTADEAIKALASPAGFPPSISLIGTVKSNPETDRVLTFSPGMTCSKWIPIPSSLIESVEPLGKIPCVDHEHDLVRLTLKEPMTPEVKALSALVVALQRDVQQAAAQQPALTELFASKRVMAIPIPPEVIAAALAKIFDWLAGFKYEAQQGLNCGHCGHGPVHRRHLGPPPPFGHYQYSCVCRLLRTNDPTWPCGCEWTVDL